MPDPRKKARRRHSRPPTDRSTNLITIGNKRGAEEIVENQVVSSKKQKIVVDTSSGMYQPAVDTMIRKKKKKREKKQKNKLEKMVVEKKPVKESSCETSSDKEEEPKKPVAPETKIVAASNKDGSSHKSESEDRSDEEVENVKLPEVENRYVAPAPVKKKGESSDDSDDWDPPEVYSSKEQFVVPTSEKPDEEPKEPVKEPVEAKTKNGVMKIETNLGSPFPPPPGGSNLVFMMNLSPSIQESDVIEFFKDDGKIDWVRFKSTLIGGRYKGYGHVRFNTSAAAQKALKRDKEDLIGYPVTLIESEERTIFDMLTPSSEQKYLFMGNLSPSVTKRDIIKFFEDAGKVVSVRLISAGGHFKGYGHVEFASSTVAHKAIRQYGQMLHGRYVELAFATERTIWHTYTPSSGKPPGFGVLRGPGYGPTKDRFRCVCTLPVPETCRRKKNQSRCRSCHRLMKSV